MHYQLLYFVFGTKLTSLVYTTAKHKHKSYLDRCCSTRKSHVFINSQLWSMTRSSVLFYVNILWWENYSYYYEYGRLEFTFNWLMLKCFSSRKFILTNGSFSCITYVLLGVNFIRWESWLNNCVNILRHCHRLCDFFQSLNIFCSTADFQVFTDSQLWLFRLKGIST